MITSKQRAYLRGLAREASDAICEELNCEGVQAIGSKVVLYRKSQKKPKIELPKAPKSE